MTQHDYKAALEIAENLFYDFISKVMVGGDYEERALEAIRHALTQPEFEVMDVQDIIGEMIDHSLSHRDVDAGSNQSTVSAVHNCTEWLAMQGYQIVRKKEVE